MGSEKKPAAATAAKAGVILPPPGQQVVGKVELPPPQAATVVVDQDLSKERAKGMTAATFPPPRAFGERGRPRPGDILLFKIDKEVFRPLLTSMVTSDGLVYGAVLFTPHDSLYEWPRLRLMVKLNRHDCWRTVEVISEGDDIGQWRWTV